jgi:phosphodiesterase/alkaline phosphatase D-like protein
LLLWTRATVDDPSAHADLSWEVAECDGGTVVAAGHAVAAAGSDHTVHVVVEGLRPGTSYTYCFRTAADECTGRTSTLPDSADRYRIGVVCCARWGWNDFASYGRLADDEPDLVLHLGDYIYEKGELPPVGPPTDPPHDTRTLADYRRRFAQHRAHPDRAAAARHCSDDRDLGRPRGREQRTDRRRRGRAGAPRLRNARVARVDAGCRR